ncbi:MAG: hypothetical protein C4557_02205 [Anaerolineaceae bacterium]|jgi:hypothetical protein|nr:MAG: hypothetical protein C4557_02205 [Anaerolineaceae bacterium]
MPKNIFQKIRGIVAAPRNIYRIAVLGIVLLAAALRISAYGDPKLSIAGNDTQSYVEASRAPLFSPEIMTGRRLLTTNLVYKIFEPKEGYQILVNGSIETTRRAIQPGFDRIAVFQLIVSIIGWGALAFMIAEFLKNPLMKILGSVLVLLFAFTPQMADWDSILMSESLTFSLFALQLALAIKMVFSLYRDPNANIKSWFIAWLIVFFFWVFLRDSNLSASIATIFVMAGVLFTSKYRKNRCLYGGVAFLIAIVILGAVTSAGSIRSQVQITNIYKDDIFPSPGLVSIFTDFGMPPPNSTEYQAWFKDNGSKTLFRFMLAHPGYAVTKIMRDFPEAFTEIKQTYFKAPELRAREYLMRIGDAIHAERTTPFLLSGFLLIGIVYLAALNTISDSRPWAWLAAWLFLTAGITMIPTILGDTWALNRHALFSTMIYRLCIWLFPVIILDMAAGHVPPTKSIQPTDHEIH